MWPPERAEDGQGPCVSTDLSTLLAAPYVKTDDRRGGIPRLSRPLLLSGSELVCVAVAQALLGYHSEEWWLGYASKHLIGMFPDARPSSVRAWRPGPGLPPTAAEGGVRVEVGKASCCAATSHPSHPRPRDHAQAGLAKWGTSTAGRPARHGCDSQPMTRHTWTRAGSVRGGGDDPPALQGLLAVSDPVGRTGVTASAIYVSRTAGGRPRRPSALAGARAAQRRLIGATAAC